MRILLDCDGILANFAASYIDVLKTVTGKEFKETDLTACDYLSALNLKHLDSEVNSYLFKQNFCFSIAPYEGAKEGFKKLQEIGEVTIVTSPMRNAPFWMYERSVWLKEHFGIEKENLIFASKKYFVTGDVFVDDDFEQYRYWRTEHFDKLCLMWTRPWNAKLGFLKVDNWDLLCGYIQGWDYGRETAHK